ncbi:hypothetical protein [Draconibacterium mangrovi]|uniref:hypothetical protein n=1 Tax=Draconibacterium mangrovi TaxID=2697469 RepID=UPI0013CF422E|nr:hypothetical protein [Draconibacterium mangrovi]
MRKTHLYWWFLGILIVFAVYKTWFAKVDDLEVALKLAGANRRELEKVIAHYKNVDEDKEKLKATQFLISNSIIHASQKTGIRDIYHNSIQFNPLDYKDFPSVREAKDSLFKVSQVTTIINYDIQELRSDFLIKHIDRCFKIWRGSPWKDKIDFDKFCNYILPYRGTSESICYWPEELYNKYQNVLDTIQEKTIINTCIALNTAIANDISYDNRWVARGLGVQSIHDILETKSGMCDDLTVYGLCVMRSFGIPVSIDFDIHGRHNYGHSWCVVFDESGDAESFGPGEQHPGEHKHTFAKSRYRTLAKVFRKNFSANEDGLYLQVNDENDIPPFFRVRNISDVTKEYIKTYNIEYMLEQPLSVKQKYLYICVFNNGVWKPVQWGEISQDHVVFENMGADILYMIGCFNKKRIYPVSEPFILKTDGSKKFLGTSSVKVSKQFAIKVIKGYEAPKKNKEYYLYFWENRRWNLSQTIIVNKDSLLDLANLNKNTLYKFQNFSRPFTVNDSTFTWW